MRQVSCRVLATHGLPTEPRSRDARAVEARSSLPAGRRRDSGQAGQARSEATLRSSEAPSLRSTRANLNDRSSLRSHRPLRRSRQSQTTPLGGSRAFGVLEFRACFKFRYSDFGFPVPDNWVRGRAVRPGSGIWDRDLLMPKLRYDVLGRVVAVCPAREPASAAERSRSLCSPAPSRDSLKHCGQSAPQVLE